jgi:hypothetical protein
MKPLIKYCFSALISMVATTSYAATGTILLDFLSPDLALDPARFTIGETYCDDLDFKGSCINTGFNIEDDDGILQAGDYLNIFVTYADEEGELLEGQLIADISALTNSTVVGAFKPPVHSPLFDVVIDGTMLTASFSTGKKGLSNIILDFTPADTTVPVPAAAWLFGSALIGLAGIKRKK